MAFSDLSPVEAQIIGAFLAEIERYNAEVGTLEVGVDTGGGGMDYKGAYDRFLMEYHIAASDETTIYVRDRSNKNNAVVFFVHGNDADVISDATNNLFTRRLLASAEAVADELA